MGVEIKFYNFLQSEFKDWTGMILTGKVVSLPCVQRSKLITKVWIAIYFDSGFFTQFLKKENDDQSQYPLDFPIRGTLKLGQI